MIMIQICTSLAALALQLTSWNTVIADVVAACGTTGKSLEALLQFLAVLPEEAYDGRRIILSVSDGPFLANFRTMSSVIVLRHSCRATQITCLTC